MGQQQLILVVLSVIIVGVAVVVGIGMFQDNMTERNREAATSGLFNLGVKARNHYEISRLLG
ncbi:MAG: hypothetical protein H8E87_04250 [FCB group bacterium]|nr:hypothetical protein [FCB group bacterium]